MFWCNDDIYIMDKKKRYLFILNLCLSGLAVIFVATALGTDHWVVASPVRNVGDDIVDSVLNLTDGDPGTKFSGKVNVGLFEGYKQVDHAFGPRNGAIKVQCDVGKNLCGFVSFDEVEGEIQKAIVRYENLVQKQSHTNDSTTTDPDHGLFNYGLFVSTVLFAAMAICWGVVGMAFAALNTGMRPIETINGPMGLYIWNGCADTLAVSLNYDLFLTTVDVAPSSLSYDRVFSCLLCIAMYAALFIKDLSYNVMSPDDLENHWTSDGYAHLDYSFYFILISAVLFLLNIILLAVSGTECRPLRSRFSANMAEKSTDGVMMY